jgi:hypothetical protein
MPIDDALENIEVLETTEEAIRNYKTFNEIWDLEIKHLAMKCAKGAGLIRKLELAQNSDTDDEIKKINSEIEAYGKKDWMSVWYISQMICSVEHDMADGRDPKLRISGPRGTLNSESFYEGLKLNEIDEQEIHNYRKLGSLLNDAMNLPYITH